MGLLRLLKQIQYVKRYKFARGVRFMLNLLLHPSFHLRGVLKLLRPAYLCRVAACTPVSKHLLEKHNNLWHCDWNMYSIISTFCITLLNWLDSNSLCRSNINSVLFSSVTEGCIYRKVISNPLYIVYCIVCGSVSQLEKVACKSRRHAVFTLALLSSHPQKPQSWPGL